MLPTLDEVRLYEDAFEHVKLEHPEIPAELPSLVDLVINAICNPTLVEASYGASLVFVDDATTNASGDPLRVPVKRITATSGQDVERSPSEGWRTKMASFGGKTAQVFR